MKEPGLDNRHRDKARPKAGRFQQKRGQATHSIRTFPGTHSPVPVGHDARDDEEEDRENQREDVRQAAKVTPPQRLRYPVVAARNP